MREDLKKSVCIPLGVLLSDAILAIDKGSIGVAFVVSPEFNVIGSLTDGDVRRALLAGKKLEDPIDIIMNTSPIVASVADGVSECHALMKRHGIRQIPRLDGEGVLVDFVLLDDPMITKKLENDVIIIAGGLGTRLYPLTENIPKPMLDVGGKPILQSIIEDLRSQGLHRFTLCVNYLSEVIINHFEDGHNFGVEIKYVHEDRRMGTGGALSLLGTSPELPCIVMNGDIVTNLDFRRLYEFHTMNNAMATVALNEHSTTIPFGVMELSNGMIQAMVEKPTSTVFVNAGIYILSPKVFSYIKKDEAFDMPQLIQTLLDDKHDVAGFPIFESWLDVGRHNDLDKARNT